VCVYVCVCARAHVHRVSHNSGAIGELLLDIIQKCVKREKLLQFICFQSQVLGLLPNMNCYGTILYIIKQ
jgi:hypothetical protein